MPKIKITTKAKARAQAKAKALQAKRRKQLIFMGFLGLALIILLIVLLSGPGEAIDAADSFLALLGEEKMGEAYQATSRAFQDRVSETDFKNQVENMGLIQYASVVWAKKMTAGDQAELEGTITTKPGDKIPVKMTLVRVERQWQVFALIGTPAGITIVVPGEPEQPSSTPPPPVVPPEPTPLPVPGEMELRSLVYDTLQNLQQATNKKDFSSFHSFISSQWQKQISVAELKKKYQALIDNKFDKAIFIGINPVFEREPYFGFDNSMALVGYYPTKPLKVVFELKYVHENVLWKLSAAEIKLMEETGAAAFIAPSGTELNRLVLTSLLSLNEAIVQKNFNSYYQSLAKPKQQQTTIEKLQEQYRGFMDDKVSIKAISDLDPVYTAKPILSMDNQFSVQGYYEAKDFRVQFSITYLFENSTWKIVNIDLGTTITQPEPATP